MTILHKTYGSGYDDVNAWFYRAKLKSKIIIEFRDKLLFLTVDSQILQFVVSSDSLNAATVVNDKSKILKEAATFLSNDIKNDAGKYVLPCPLSVETLSSKEQDFPKSVNDFFYISYQVKRSHSY